MSLEAHGIPVAEQFAPRRVKAGTLDLTASTIFVGAFEKHAQIVKHARTLNKLVPYRHAQVNLGMVLEMFFRTLHALHSFWRQKNLLTTDDLERVGMD